MSEFYHMTDVMDNLWAEYKKTDEYKSSKSSLVGIRQDHPIIIKREEDGLSRIVSRLENELGNTRILYFKKLQQRAPSEWVAEWLSYNKTLFDRVLTSCGTFRRKDVWFDTIEASEKDYKIPRNQFVPSRMSDLAENVCS